MDRSTARRTFAHRARLALSPGADRQAPGGAVTLALCGSWEHPPPCPLAPHNTRVDGADDALEVRVVFATAPDDETEVRSRIDGALAGGVCDGPDGTRTRWTLVTSAPAAVTEAESAHAARLVAT